MNFDIKAQARIFTRDRTLIKLLKSAAIIASGVSTIFLSSDPDKFCIRLKIILQEKHGGITSPINNQEIFALVDKYLKYNWISKKQQKQNFN